MKSNLEAPSQNVPVATLNPKQITWYRTPVDRKILKELHVRSDALGFVQSLSYLGLLILTGTCAYLTLKDNIILGLLFIFLHGTIGGFLPNAIHELCHETVFKSPHWNQIFLRIVSFFGWSHFEMFNQSHSRHHRYTLHPPEDEEGRGDLTWQEFLARGFIRLHDFPKTLATTWRLARGKFVGHWENVLFPVTDLSKRKQVIVWARALLAGHGLILITAFYFHMWWLPVLTTLIPYYGKWLFRLCNNTQHQGLPDHLTDFRLCCRTFTANPVIQFLYWHMNFHTEHHMYPGVPCYRLGKLHRLIKHDLPSCPHGLIQTWLEISRIEKKQKQDPSYQHFVSLPAKFPSSNSATHLVSFPVNTGTASHDLFELSRK